MQKYPVKIIILLLLEKKIELCSAAAKKYTALATLLLL